MSQIKQCPKCNSNMSTGTLKEIGHYGNPPYEFAPDDEKPFQVPRPAKIENQFI